MTLAAARAEFTQEGVQNTENYRASQAAQTPTAQAARQQAAAATTHLHRACAQRKCRCFHRAPMAQRKVRGREAYLTEYATPREARCGLGRYFPFYNHERPHQALSYLTPAAVYFPSATA